jgi:hypothetical protein
MMNRYKISNLMEEFFWGIGISVFSAGIIAWNLDPTKWWIAVGGFSILILGTILKARNNA